MYPDPNAKLPTEGLEHESNAPGDVNTAGGELGVSARPDQDMGAVRDFYARIIAYEWARLDHYVLEFAVVRAYLQRYLPPPPARLLDIGGGPGRYAILLAQQGYDVTMLDLAPENIEWSDKQAAALGVSLRAEVGDARDLTRYADGSFDAALLLGPLYHLPRESDRATALSEMKRVIHPNGRVFTMMLTRAAAIYEGFNRWPEGALDTTGVMSLLTTGSGFNFEQYPHAFEGVYFASANEVIPLHERTGFRTVAVAGCEAMLGGRREQFERLPPMIQEKWVEIVLLTCENPALLDASERILYVGEALT